jgi:hypothetical protein
VREAIFAYFENTFRAETSISKSLSALLPHVREAIFAYFENTFRAENFHFQKFRRSTPACAGSYFRIKLKNVHLNRCGGKFNTIL